MRNYLKRSMFKYIIEGVDEIRGEIRVATSILGQFYKKPSFD